MGLQQQTTRQLEFIFSASMQPPNLQAPCPRAWTVTGWHFSQWRPTTGTRAYQPLSTAIPLNPTSQHLQISGPSQYQPPFSGTSPLLQTLLDTSSCLSPLHAFGENRSEPEVELGA